MAGFYLGTAPPLTQETPTLMAGRTLALSFIPLEEVYRPKAEQNLLSCGKKAYNQNYTETFIRRKRIMTENNGRLAVFPGTFDPITNGHLDIIRRGAKLFRELIVAVGHNPDKCDLIGQAERAEIIAEIVADLPNVRVEMFSGLTVNFMRKVGANVILRGIRNSSDLQFEFQTALTNRTVAGVETVFIMTSPEFAFTSSSLIKQIAQGGGDVSKLVPAQVLKHLPKPQGT